MDYLSANQVFREFRRILKTTTSRTDVSTSSTEKNLVKYQSCADFDYKMTGFTNLTSDTKSKLS